VLVVRFSSLRVHLLELLTGFLVQLVLQHPVLSAEFNAGLQPGPVPTVCLNGVSELGFAAVDVTVDTDRLVLAVRSLVQNIERFDIKDLCSCVSAADYYNEAESDRCYREIHLENTSDEVDDAVEQLLERPEFGPWLRPSVTGIGVFVAAVSRVCSTGF
jgi:hypothetical protein